MIVPRSGGRENQIARPHHALVAVDSGVGVLPINHEAHRVGAMTMGRSHFAGEQILKGDRHRVRRRKLRNAWIGDAQNSPFGAFAGIDEVRRAPHQAARSCPISTGPIAPGTSSAGSVDQDETRARPYSPREHLSQTAAHPSRKSWLIVAIAFLPCAYVSQDIRRFRLAAAIIFREPPGPPKPGDSSRPPEPGHRDKPRYFRWPA